MARRYGRIIDADVRVGGAADDERRAILEVDVIDGFVVDTGYVVAFEDTLTYKVSVLPGLRPGSKIKTFLFGGEGLVVDFAGRGKVWIQTRDVGPFLRWANPFRPQKSRG